MVFRREMAAKWGAGNLSTWILFTAWLGSVIKCPRERIKNRMGFSFRKWILEVSFLSFPFNLSHTSALPFLQMRQWIIEMEPKGLNSVGWIFLQTDELPFQYKSWHTCPTRALTFSGKSELENIALFCTSWYMFVSFQSGPYGMVYLVLSYLHGLPQWLSG